MLTFVTMGDVNYMTRFRVLLKSIRKYNPQSPVVLFTWGDNNVTEDVEVIHLEEQEKIYAVQRGNMVANCLERHEKIMLIGSDTEFFAPTNEAESILNQYDFAIVPHICQPLPNDDFSPSEHMIFAGGLCNADMQLWRRSHNTDKILEWYKERLKNHGHKNNRTEGFNHEQSWLNMIPFFFDNCHIWRTKCYNVAYWNFQLYNMHIENGIPVTDDGRLVLFHYSGFDPNIPEKISVYQNRYSVKGELLQFFQQYAEKIK